MKKLIFYFSLVIMMSSCVATTALVSNNLATIVELSEPNYKIIDKVSGSATVQYILGIGGNKKNALVAKARSNMLRKADLIGGSKAIINEIVEEKNQNILGTLIIKKTITVNAHVIEFIN